MSFVLDNLEATTSYRLILFAVNAKGRSEPVIIDDISFKGVAKFTGKFYCQLQQNLFAFLALLCLNLGIFMKVSRSLFQSQEVYMTSIMYRTWKESK